MSRRSTSLGLSRQPTWFEAPTALVGGGRFRLGHSTAVVVYFDDDVAIGLPCNHADAGGGPLARVVEQIAEHLFQIFTVACKADVLIDIDLDVQSARRVQSAHTAGDCFSNVTNVGRRSLARPNAGGARELSLD